MFICEHFLAEQNVQVSTCVFHREKKNPVQKSHRIFCPGNQGDANFQVPLALLRLHVAMYHFYNEGII